MPERESNRVLYGKIVAAFIRSGWRPPPMHERAFDRLVRDIGRADRELSGWGSTGTWSTTGGATLELSPAELRNFKLLAEGLNQREIATALGISYDSVKDTTKHARERLGAKSSPHAIAILFRQGALT